eukprot:5447665-Amphidinium_carterae.1
MHSPQTDFTCLDITPHSLRTQAFGCCMLAHCAKLASDTILGGIIIPYMVGQSFLVRKTRTWCTTARAFGFFGNGVVQGPSHSKQNVTELIGLLSLALLAYLAWSHFEIPVAVLS